MNDVYKKMREKIQTLFDEAEKEIESDCIYDDWLGDFSQDLCCSIKDNFKLYRYSHSDYWNIRNIEKNQLKLSPAGDMNDFFEGVSSSDISRLKSYEIEDLNDIAYMKCFSENPDILLMWSHYANKGAGICVEYDLSLLKKDEAVLQNIYPVVYTDSRRFNVNYKYIAQDSYELSTALRNCDYPADTSWLDNIKFLFLNKYIGWSYEKEWRLLVTKKQMFDTGEEKQIFTDRIVPFNCITGIYFGVRTESGIKEHLIEIAKRANALKIEKGIGQLIKCYQMNYHETNYEVISSEVLLEE